MFRILSAILIIVFAVIHVNAASPMNMDGNASVVVVSNADDGKQRDSADVKLTTVAVDCCDEENMGKQPNASHCQIDCGLVGQQIRNRTLLQMRNIDIALGSFTISNEPEIPLRPPIA
jgi:hypothetical protein